MAEGAIIFLLKVVYFSIERWCTFGLTNTFPITIDSDLEVIIRKSMTPRPADRIQTAEEMRKIILALSEDFGANNNNSNSQINQSLGLKEEFKSKVIRARLKGNTLPVRSEQDIYKIGKDLFTYIELRELINEVLQENSTYHNNINNSNHNNNFNRPNVNAGWNSNKIAIIIVSVVIVLIISGFVVQKTSNRNFTGYKSTVLENGDYYSGDWVEGRFSGNGTYTYSDSKTYEGQWRNGEKNGYGIMTWPNGDVYDGYWLDDKRSGEGTQTYADGRKYIGNWVESVMTGSGTYYYSDGSSFVGEWVNGLISGEGTYTMPDGAEFSGSWNQIGSWVYYEDGRYFDIYN